ncbi:MAG: 6-bladed beta-propeller [Acidobacteriia bacterium]|nr:6-bladed beta-propeller [Terriglobia bacterium]
MHKAAISLLLSGLLFSADWKPVQTWPPVPDTVQWAKPSAVLALADGGVMIFQRGAPALLRFSAGGKMVSAFSSGFFQNAHGLKMAPDGNIWVTDYTRHVIVKFSPEGKQLLMLGKLDQIASDREHFGGVADLAFLPNGDFYVADGYKNSRVVKFDRTGKYLMEWGRPGTGPGEFHLPHCVAIDTSGKVYVGDRENKRIQIFTADGKYLNEWRTGSPYGITFAADGTLWMADGVNNRVVQIDKAGRVIDSFDLPVDKPDGTGGHMLSVAADGSVYVAETGRFKVRKYVRSK